MTQQVKQFNVLLSWKEGFNIAALLNDFFVTTCVTFVSLDIRWKQSTITNASDPFLTLTYQEGGGNCLAYVFTGDGQQSAADKATAFFAANETISLLSMIYATPPHARYTSDDVLLCVTTTDDATQNRPHVTPAAPRADALPLSTEAMNNPFPPTLPFFVFNASQEGADPAEGTWKDGGLNFAVSGYSEGLSGIANWCWDGAGGGFAEDPQPCQPSAVFFPTGLRITKFEKINDVSSCTGINDTLTNTGEAYATESLTQLLQNSLQGTYENTGCSAHGGIGVNMDWGIVPNSEHFQLSFVKVGCCKYEAVLGLSPYTDSKATWDYSDVQWAVTIEKSSEPAITPNPPAGAGGPLLAPLAGPGLGNCSLGGDTDASSAFVP